MKFLQKILLYAIYCTVWFVSCNSDSKIFFVADYDGLVTINNSKPQLLSRLSGNNYIHTGASSYCLVQCENKGLIIIYANSDVYLDANTSGDSNRLIISMPQGIVDIVYSSKEKDAVIKTDSCLLSGDVQNVRVLSQQNSTCIVNIDSKITVSFMENNKEYSKFIEKNKMFMTTGLNSGYFDITAQVVDSFKELKNIQYAVLEQNIQAVIPPLLKEKIQDFGNRDVKDDISLTLLEKQKGPLKKVITKNGIIYKGYVTAKGKVLEIMTMQGVISIPQNSIKYVLSYQPMYDY